MPGYGHFIGGPFVTDETGMVIGREEFTGIKSIRLATGRRPPAPRHGRGERARP